MSGPTNLRPLLTPDEVADLLRTTRRGIYGMAERGQLAGAVKVGRRLLIRRDDLLRSLKLSPREVRTWE